MLDLCWILDDMQDFGWNENLVKITHKDQARNAQELSMSWLQPNPCIKNLSGIAHENGWIQSIKIPVTSIMLDLCWNSVSNAKKTDKL